MSRGKKRTEDEMAIYVARAEEMRFQQGASWKEIAKEFGFSNESSARSSYRRYKQQFPGAVTEHLQSRGIDPNNVRVYWDKTPEASVMMRFDAPSPDAIVERFDELMETRYGKIPLGKVKTFPEGNLLLVDPADVHLGKLATKQGSLYNLPIALARAKEGVRGVIEKAKGFKPKQVLFVMGNDILHIDNPRRTTTSGTPQDTDGMWHDAFDGALLFYSQVIEWLKEIAPVHCVYCPSNHDYISGYMLSKGVQAWFRKDKKVTFDVTISPRKYYKHGTTLIGLGHGDGAKEEKLPSIMAHEARKQWAEAEYCYWILHHMHHQKVVNYKFIQSEDHIGATVTYMRSPSGTDRWHDSNGYIGGKCAVEGKIFSDTNGETCHLVHNF